MGLLNNDRLSHWLVGAVLGWSACLLLVFIPIFHWGLGFAIAKVAISAGCVGQLAVTPWLFSARVTTQNPAGKIAKRAVAVILWLSSSALLFLYYITHDYPTDSQGREVREILFGTTIVFGIVGLIVVGLLSRHRWRS